MKKMIVALIAMTALNASATYVTETVCNFGESGTECKTITYKVRPSEGLNLTPEQCGNGELYPCEPKEYGVPSWMHSDGNNAPAWPGEEAP